MMTLSPAIFGWFGLSRGYFSVTVRMKNDCDRPLNVTQFGGERSKDKTFGLNIIFVVVNW
jgi:hypothetical protein